MVFSGNIQIRFLTIMLFMSIIRHNTTFPEWFIINTKKQHSDNEVTTI